jgi:hypothetical protein
VKLLPPAAAGFPARAAIPSMLALSSCLDSLHLARMVDSSMFEALIPSVPAGIEGFFLLFQADSPKHIQRVLTHWLEALLRVDARVGESLFSKAVRLSSSGRNAGALLTTIPTSSRTTCTNQEIIQEVRLRIAGDPYDNMPRVCPGCGQDLLADPHHWLSCAVLVGAYRIFRHNLLMEVITHFLSLMVCAISVEPRVQGFHDQADILVVFPSGTRYLIDVRVPTPSCKSYLSKAQVRGAVAKSHEVEKIRKHGEQAAAAHAVMVPFVVEAYGTMGEHAYNFIKTMAEEIISVTRRSPSPTMVAALRAEITGAIAVALHRGNAACLHRGLVSAVASWAG